MPPASRPTNRLITRRLMLVLAVLIAGLSASSIARAAAPGSLDPSFGSGGSAKTGTGTQLFGTAVQSDGKVVAVGQTGGSTLLLARFTASGALDPSFGNHGLASVPATGAPFPGSIGRAVAVQSDGKIVVVGSSGPTGGGGLLVERFTANGRPDSGFGKGGALNLLTKDLANGFAVAIQPDGKILAAGAATTLGTGGLQPRVVVVRLNANGSPDTRFGSAGVDVLDLGPVSAAQGVAVQSDGKIVLAGSTTPGLQVPIAYVARLTSSGGLDKSFAGKGYYAHQYARAGANSGFNAVAVQSDGKIVAGGAAVAGTLEADALLVRFTASGAQDSSFGSGGAVYETSAVNSPPGASSLPGIKSITIAAGGDIVGAGYALDGPYSNAVLWALTPAGRLDTRFGSHGSAVTQFGGDRFNEFSALALAPNGDLVAVGDTQQGFQGAYTGVAARYIGFGPAPPVIPPLKVAIHGVSRTYKTSSVVKHGLKVGVSCNQACSIKASLGLSAATARKLHIQSTFTKCTKVHGKKRCRKVHGYRAVTLASGHASRRGPGTSTITLRLKTRYVSALLRARRFTASLKVSATATAGHGSKTIHMGILFTR
jgi:uncharacterized delta-60 repeat protein